MMIALTVKVKLDEAPIQMLNMFPLRLPTPLSTNSSIFFFLSICVDSTNKIEKDWSVFSDLILLSAVYMITQRPVFPESNYFNLNL